MAKIFSISKLPVSNPFPFLERPFTLKPIFEEVKDFAQVDTFKSQVKDADRLPKFPGRVRKK